MSAISVSVMLLITVAIEKVSSSGVSCHDKILGYERIGAYQDKETFNAALSYCNPPSGI